MRTPKALKVKILSKETIRYFTVPETGVVKIDANLIADLATLKHKITKKKRVKLVNHFYVNLRDLWTAGELIK